MKYIYLFSLLFFVATSISAQKYVLLDKHMANKPKFSNSITSIDKIHNYIPIEKKYLPEFVKSLEEIATLLSDNSKGTPKEYNFGCVKIKGQLVSLESGNRLDYVITSVCKNTNISMHISDAKMANKNNFIFINTWIKYIKNNLKILIKAR